MFIGIGGTGCQFMRCTMNIGIFMLVEIGNPINHALRFLRGRCIVKPDQRTAIDPFLQDGKVTAYGMYIQWLCRAGKKLRL